MTTQEKVAESSAAPAPGATFVLFGARGDLTRRLLVPALYDLRRAGLLDNGFRILGLDKAQGSTADWVQRLEDAIHEEMRDPQAEFSATAFDSTVWNWLKERMEYRQLDLDDVAALRTLGQSLQGNAVFYLAVPSRFFASAVEALGQAGLTRESEGCFRRVVIEKPFGLDLASARELNRRVLAVLDESQLFRIDHFLGKETVQNILALRFGNRFLEPAWNATHIDSVQITAAETIGVEGRGAFYEPTGALRDMVPNHLFQLLAMVAMERPLSLSAQDLREARQHLFAAITPVAPADAVRGQYGAGTIGGADVPAYRDNPGVAPDSRTETYVALRMGIDNPRWSGVPFYLRTGKALCGHLTEVVIRFRPPEGNLFSDPDVGEGHCLILNVQPDEGITFRFSAKKPGPQMRLADVEADFRYRTFFPPVGSVGYETLLYDCLRGDQALFQRADNIEASWAALEPVLEAWARDPKGPEPYAAGTVGPGGAAELLARDGRAWHPILPVSRTRT